MDVSVVTPWLNLMPLIVCLPAKQVVLLAYSLLF